MQHFLREEICKFEADHLPNWCVQFSILFKRRLGIIFFKPRNIVSLILIFILIAIENISMALKLEFFSFRVLITLIIFISEEAIQRANKYKQLVYISGISIFQYNFSILLADVLVLTILYCAAFLGFLIASATYLDLEFYSSMIVVIIIGNFATLSFTYLVCLFTDQPLLLQGIYQIFISYFTFYLFSCTSIAGLFLPNILSSYLMSISNNKAAFISTQPKF